METINVTLEMAVENAIKEFASVTPSDCGCQSLDHRRRPIVEALTQQAHNFARKLAALPANDAAALMSSTFTANYEPRSSMWIQAAKEIAWGKVYTLSGGVLCFSANRRQPAQWSTEDEAFLAPFRAVLRDVEEEYSVCREGMTCCVFRDGKNWFSRPADLQAALDRWREA